MEVVASLSQGCTAAAQCSLFTYKSVPVIFEPPCILYLNSTKENTLLHIHGNNGYVNVPQYYVICTLPIIYF